MHDRREFWGWLLFTLSAVAFLAAAVRDGDLLVGVASAAFLVGCALFLLAYPRR